MDDRILFAIMTLLAGYFAYLDIKLWRAEGSKLALIRSVGMVFAVFVGIVMIIIP